LTGPVEEVPLTGVLHGRAFHYAAPEAQNKVDAPVLCLRRKF
jgi:hypothetical protein